MDVDGYEEVWRPAIKSSTEFRPRHVSRAYMIVFGLFWWGVGMTCGVWLAVFTLWRLTGVWIWQLSK